MNSKSFQNRLDLIILNISFQWFSDSVVCQVYHYNIGYDLEKTLSSQRDIVLGYMYILESSM